MKHFVLGILLILAVAAVAAAQETATGGSAAAGNQTSAQKKGRQIELQSGTQVTAQLESALDARRAKPGDRVVLKTLREVKQNGQVIIQKGSRLLGRVTDVQQQTKASGESHIGLVFDRLRSGSTEIPIAASVLSVMQTHSQARTNNTDFETDTMAQSSTSTRTSTAPAGSSGGGLLGGVGNTVGGVVNTTTSTVGNVAGSTTNAVGSTVGATKGTAGELGGSLSGLQITQSSNVSAESGSTLSLTGRNLRLESGATFNLAVSNSTSASGPH